MRHWTIAMVCLALIAGVSGCKRNSAVDPGGGGPAAYQITLKGTANPSTLYIPRNRSEVQSVITVRAINNDGTPVAGRDVIFTLDTALGYFGNFQTSLVRPTNSQGEIQVLYIIPAGTALAASGTLNVVARLEDDTRLDNPGSEIYDLIPIQVIAAEYDQTPFTLRGTVKLVDGTGLEFALVTLKDTATGNSMVLVTRPSGSWDALVPYGWTGTVTASLSGYSFSPASYTFGTTNPVYQDISGLDFISTNTAAFGSLSVDTSDLTMQEVAGNVPNTQGSCTIYVTNSLNDNQIDYTVSSSNPSWLTVGSGSGNTNQHYAPPNSYGQFTVNWTANTAVGAIQRSGTITITSVTPGVSQTVTFTVTQDP